MDSDDRPPYITPVETYRCCHCGGTGIERFYNGHRPHQGIANARLLCPLPPPITGPDQMAHPNTRRHQRLGDILHKR